MRNAGTGTFLRIVLSAMLVCSTGVSVAGAAPYSLQFTFTTFHLLGGGSGAAPVDPVSGTVFFDKSDTDFTVASVTSIDLTIDGHVYSVPPVTGLGASVGSNCTSACAVTPNTDSFAFDWFVLTGKPAGFAYSVAGIDKIFVSETASQFEFEPTPLPAALPLFATGLGALGLLGWRRKKKSETR